MKLSTAIKGVTWVELLLGIEEGSEDRFPYSKRAYISSLISRDLKLKYPDREFKTQKEGEDILIVKRIK